MRLEVTLSGLADKNLINFSGSIEPDRRPKQKGKKKRSLQLVLIFQQKIKPIRLFMDRQARIAFVYGRRDSPIVIGPEIIKPNHTQLLVYYERSKKPKILNACFFGGGHPVTDIHRALAACDHVIACDTNYKQNGRGQTVACSTAIRARTTNITDEACWTQSSDTICMTARDVKADPERHGLWRVLQAYSERFPEMRHQKNGLITDTAFDLVERINQRQVPLFEDHMLPENVVLFYATADAGSAEYMPNRLIKECDKIAGDKLQRVLAGE